MGTQQHQSVAYLIHPFTFRPFPLFSCETVKCAHPYYIHREDSP